MNQKIESKLKRRLFIDYVIVYFVIAFSGIPFFDENKLARSVFLGFLIIIFIFRQHKIDRRFILLVLVFLTIEIIQISIWGGRIFTLLSSLTLLVLLPYLAIKIVGLNFLAYSVNIIYAYSLISLFFWTATNFVFGFHDFTYKIAELLKPYTPHEITESFILYTYENAKELGFYRNPGPFHEPGAFGVFLVYALVVNYIQDKKVLNIKGIVLLLAAATTFSTATYLSILVLIVALNLFLVKKLGILTLFLVPFLIYLSLALYNNADFMGNKIAEQYVNQTEASLTTPTSGRILGARKAMVAISQYPITGKGLIAYSKSDPTSQDAAGYGWITWISQIGLPLGILYMLFFFKSLKRYSIINNTESKFALIAFISLLIVLAGQKQISTVLFFMVFFVSFIYKKHPYKKNIKQELLYR